MTDIPEPRFFESNNKPIAHLEWEAIRMICFEGSHEDIGEAYPKFEQRHFHWMDPFNAKATNEHHAVLAKVKRGEYRALDDFYEALKPLLKPKKRGEALKDAKKRTSQRAYLKELYGDDFVEGKKAMFREARQVARYIADKGNSQEVFADQLAQLVFKHGASDFSDGQITTIQKNLEEKVEKHLKLDRVEAAILDDDDKNLYFMWGKIKREYPKGDTFTWPTAKAAKACHCSKQDVKPIMKKLEKLGAIKLLQTGKRGAHSSRAALYVREA